MSGVVMLWLKNPVSPVAHSGKSANFQYLISLTRQPFFLLKQWETHKLEG